MASIQFDGTEILTSAYIPQFVKHESVADRQLMALPLAREDGEVMIAERYGRKIIVLQGTLVAASQSALDTAIDAFKELFSRPEKNLDVSWEGGTLRFVATCTRHDFDRDHFHTNAVPWTAEFTVLSGEGKATATTDALLDDSYDLLAASDTFSLLGSKPPRPVILLEDVDGDATGYRGIEYKNIDTGERLVITYPGAWGNNRTVTIDCEEKTVEGDVVDGVTKALNFAGVFPRFKIGTNTIKITAGGLVNQKSADDAIGEVTTGTSTVLEDISHLFAQSFMVPYTDATFQGIIIAVRKNGAPGNITWRIETDNNGEPSGSLVHANATGTILTADVGTSAGYVTDYSTNPFTLEANTVYWLVFSATSLTAGVDWYTLARANDPSYPRGLGLKFGGASWAAIAATKTDLAFRILHGGIGVTSADTVLHTVTYYKTYL